MKLKHKDLERVVCQEHAYFYIVIIKKYKVKQILQQISGKTGINFLKFSADS